MVKPEATFPAPQRVDFAFLADLHETTSDHLLLTQMTIEKMRLIIFLQMPSSVRIVAVVAMIGLESGEACEQTRLRMGLCRQGDTGPPNGV